MTDQPALAGAARQMDLADATQSEFITAIAHLYRGELGQATVWRTRIDTTTNWAVVLSATALSFVFSGSGGERHVLIPIVSLFCTFFLLIEARRYRFYDIWRSRARTLEINFYRPLLDGSAPVTPDWTERLSQDLTWPHFHLPWWEAAGRRLRRNYQWIYGILLGCWFVVLMTHPTVTTSPAELVARAHVGPLPGWLVFSGMLLSYGILAALGIYSLWASRWRKDLPAGHPERMRGALHEHL